MFFPAVAGGEEVPRRERTYSDAERGWSMGGKEREERRLW